VSPQVQIEDESRRLLSFARPGSTRDADGHATASHTALGTAYGDIQPESGGIRETPTASIEGAARAGFTHVAYLEDRPAFGIVEKDLVTDPNNGLVYEVVMVHDFNPTWPQELDLRRASNVS
jgi:hypothetical protein